MKHLLHLAHVIALCLLTCLLWGCGGDSDQEVMDDSMRQLKEMNAVLDTVKDEPSAKAAAEKIRGMQDEFRSLSKRMQEMGEAKDMTEAEKAALAERYAGEYGTVLKDFHSNMTRIQQRPELAKHFEEAFAHADKRAAASKP